jgi:hypothetical protein
VSIPTIALADAEHVDPKINAINAMTIAPTHAIADTGATGIFIMDGSKVENKRLATKPLIINLPDGTKVKSTHECDITIPGLPKILTGHIVPKLSIASLIGIRVLCEAGCKVTFSKRHCNVYYNEKLILRGFKDPSTDLWTLPLTTTPTMQQPTTPAVQHVAAGKIRPPSTVQSKNIQTHQSHSQGIPQRVPKYK